MERFKNGSYLLEDDLEDGIYEELIQSIPILEVRNMDFVGKFISMLPQLKPQLVLVSLNIIYEWPLFYLQDVLISFLESNFKELFNNTVLTENHDYSTWIPTTFDYNFYVLYSMVKKITKITNEIHDDLEGALFKEKEFLIDFYSSFPMDLNKEIFLTIAKTQVSKDTMNGSLFELWVSLNQSILRLTCLPQSVRDKYASVVRMAFRRCKIVLPSYEIGKILCQIEDWNSFTEIISYLKDSFIKSFEPIATVFLFPLKGKSRSELKVLLVFLLACLENINHKTSLPSIYIPTLHSLLQILRSEKRRFPKEYDNIICNAERLASSILTL